MAPHAEDYEGAKPKPGSGASSGEDGSPAPADATTAAPPSEEEKPSMLKKFLEKSELDLPTVLILMKGGLPPAIALALLQVDVIANHFGTIGYLVAIISVIGFAVLPRAKFIQTMLTNLVMLCFGAAVALLVGYCSTQARAHTSVITAQSAQEYNSSASAVCAVWLFFQVYIANAARGKYPQLQLPVILYSIFSVVSCISSPRFPTMTYAISFVEKLLEAFLTGLAIATAVSFLVVPLSVRTIILKQFAGYMALLQKGLKTYQAYLASLEDPANVENAFITDRTKDYKPNPLAMAVSGVVAAITGLHGKIQGDLPFAKREIAVGKIPAEELSNINKLIRGIMLPTVGLSALTDLMERVAFFHGWSQKHLDEGLNEKEQAERTAIVKEWSDNLKALHEPFESIVSVTCEGLDHVAYLLEFKKRPKAAEDSGEADVEAKAQATQPGEPGFAEYMQKKIDEYYGGKKEMLRDWCGRHGIDLPPDFFEKVQTSHYTPPDEPEDTHESNRRQLYLLLYMEFLFYSAATGVLAFVKFADELVSNGTMSKTKLILPGWKRLTKWIKNFLNAQEGPTDDTRGDLGDINQAATLVDLGTAYNAKKDPEHLPPRNVMEKIGDGVRVIPRFLRSDASAFGFRVAAATMSIGVAAFIESSQVWFTKHRALWALIMIAISMTPTAGQSVFSFSLRIFGTIVAMVVSFMCYYIPDKHRAGVIVFVWLFTSIGMWIPLKRPQLAVVGIISIVTNILILGYTLLAEKLGQAVIVSNGQEYLPIYKLGPYRLATVATGLGVAFVFTILPYPMTEHSLLRQNVGGALYILANYYSIVHESIQARIKDVEGDLEDKNSLGAKLTKLRTKVFTKQVLMLTNLRTFSDFQKYEIPVGGRFPKEQYDILVKSIDNIMKYISLLSYASHSFKDEDHHLGQWSKDLKQILGTIGHTSTEITSLLSILSASVTNGQPLPPYMTSPEPYRLTKKLEELDPDILSVRHIDEPEYAIFAVFQVASRAIIFELEMLLKTVKELVGELDFSFHVVSTANSSQTVLGDHDDDPTKYPEGYKKKGD